MLLLRFEAVFTRLSFYLCGTEADMCIVLTSHFSKDTTYLQCEDLPMFFKQNHISYSFIVNWLFYVKTTEIYGFSKPISMYGSTRLRRKFHHWVRFMSCRTLYHLTSSLCMWSDRIMLSEFDR